MKWPVLREAAIHAPFPLRQEQKILDPRNRIKCMKRHICSICKQDITCPLCQGDGMGPFDVPYSASLKQCPKCRGTGAIEHRHG